MFSATDCFNEITTSTEKTKPSVALLSAPNTRKTEHVTFREKKPVVVPDVVLQSAANMIH